MKIFNVFIVTFFLAFNSYSQDPTLAVGLETLTLNKGVIDVQALTEVIMEKQTDLKQEALKRFMFKMFPETNFTTKFYVQNCLNALLNEKNPQVIEKEILEHTTNYALALGVAKAYTLNPGLSLTKRAYKNFLAYSPFYRSKLIDDYKDYKSAKSHTALQKSLDSTNSKIQYLIKEIGDKGPAAAKAQYAKLKALEKDRREHLNRIQRISIRNRDAFEEPGYAKSDSLPFGVLLDVVSEALSEIKELRDRGFFKKQIDYKTDSFYKKISSSKTTTPETDLRDCLIDLKEHIKRNITGYVTHYDIIKEFYLTKIEQTDTVSMKTALLSQYMNMISGITEDADLQTTVNAVVNKNNIKHLSGHTSNLLKQFSVLEKASDSLHSMSLYTRKLKSDLVSYKAGLGKRDSISSLLPGAIDSDTLTLQAQLQKTNALLIELSSSFAKDLNSVKKILNSLPKTRIIERAAIPLDLTINSAPIVLSIFQDTISAIEKSVDNEQSALAEDVIETGDLLNLYLQGMIQSYSSLSNFSGEANNITENNKEHLLSYTDFVNTVYNTLNILAKRKDISLKDINLIDQEIIPKLIKYGILFNGDQKLKNQIKQFRLLSQLLKIKAITSVQELSTYQPALIDLFAFISNLDNLDRAETYQSVLNLLQDNNGKVEDNLEEGKFKEIYLLFSNAIRKYTLINTARQYVQLDVVSFLNELQLYFNRNNNSVFGLYLTLGLNQNLFLRDVSLPGENEKLKNIGFA